MVQRVYVKVIGFSDEERHSLNTLFRLSEQCRTMYQLWSTVGPEPPRLALLDADSYEARVEAESLRHPEMRVLWVGDDPPACAFHVFRRPIDWPDVLQVMDDMVLLEQPLDFDLEDPDAGPGWPETMLQKRALIVSASRDERLYLRARLALARLTQADEAETGSEALQLAHGNQYDVALVDFALPDMDGWALLRELRQGRRSIPHVAMTKGGRSLPEQLRARLAGAVALFDKPPHPERLHELLMRV